MREGKYVEELYRWIKQIPDDFKYPHEMFLFFSRRIARDHPVWYARFWIRSWFVRLWRWVISRKWFKRSKRRGGSIASGAGGDDCGD